MQQVILTGVREDVTKSEAVEKLAVLFKTTPGQVEKLLETTRYVVKKGIPENVAQQYQAAISATGATCHIEQEIVPAQTLDIDFPPQLAPQDEDMPPPIPQTNSHTLNSDSTASSNASGLIGMRKEGLVFCSKCGTQAAVDASFCGGCGAAISSTDTSAKSQPTPPPVQTASVQGVDAEAAKIFIGKNHEYFLKKWALVEQGKIFSWNWAAFIGGFAWMAYRKMYLYSWIFIGVVIVETLCEYAFGLSDRLSMSINIAIASMLGSWANFLYKQHTEKKIKEITAMNTPDLAKFELVRQGGTSIGAAIGFCVVLVTIGILVAAVAER